MRKPEKCNISYCGFSKPRSIDEIEFEILGLTNLIKKVEERITALNQSSFLANKAMEKNIDNIDSYFEEEDV
jgi:hypothetical protein|tara:strand:- start:5446 stop:5661 length:216 start_codon:yes stop_codon:yes gene_type:complete